MSDDDLIRRGDAKRALILGDTFTRAQAKLDAIPAVTPGVMVKPLVWEAITENVHETIGFNSVYQVRSGTDGVVRWQERYMGDWQSVDNINAAKAAAQADYESRMLAAIDLTPQPVPFQDRVGSWMDACFGAEISGDKLERGDRLLEEVFELLQSGDYPRERVAALEEYVWSRGVGDPSQEVGGVMVTLAAYCLAHGIDMHGAGETEITRVWTKVEKIRAKQASKPKGSALPQIWQRPDPQPAPDVAGLVEAMRGALQVTRDRFASFKFNSLGDFYDPSKDSDFAEADAALAAMEGKP